MSQPANKGVEFPSTLVDFHVHLFPDRLFEAIWDRFVLDYNWKVLHRLYWRQCIEYLREQGVEKIVYSNYAHKGGIANTLNAWNRKVLDQTEGVYCFAAFHPDDPDALPMIRNMYQHPKVLGVKLQFLVTNFYPTDERLFVLYEETLAQNKRILFHAGTGPVGNEFVGAKNFLPVMERYPDLNANVAHMGGLEYGAFMDMLETYPNLYMDTSFSFLPGLSYDQGGERLSKNRDKILYGSDFPNLIHPREKEFEGLLSYGLDQDFYDKVCNLNGRKLLEPGGPSTGSSGWPGLLPCPKQT